MLCLTHIVSESSMSRCAINDKFSLAFKFLIDCCESYCIVKILKG